VPNQAEFASFAAWASKGLIGFNNLDIRGLGMRRDAPKGAIK